MTGFRLILALVAVLLAHPALSDELRPGYLEMRQISSDTYNLLFKVPARGEDLRLAIYVKLPEGTQDVGLPRASFTATPPSRNNGSRPAVARCHPAPSP